MKPAACAAMLLCAVIGPAQAQVATPAQSPTVASVSTAHERGPWIASSVAVAKSTLRLLRRRSRRS